ncbi:hypothetical protein BDZ88DRAFT_508315 [Geranomyces variabilis]|nr:hypothetical protein BDZ88DRAFT_508315 [Geranomyces variabilis]KAJ3134418.1 hypothetical protein HDU90_005031 [Geranomyces variabilis]
MPQAKKAARKRPAVKASSDAEESSSFSSDESSRLSEGNDSSSDREDEMAEIMLAIKNRISKRTAARRKKTDDACAELCSRVRSETEKLLATQTAAETAIITKHQQQMDELFAKRTSLVEQIKTEAQNYERGQQVWMERILACARKRVLLKDSLRDRLQTADAVPIKPFELVATPSVHHERAHPTPEQSAQKKRRIPDLLVPIDGGATQEHDLNRPSACGDVTCLRYAATPKMKRSTENRWEALGPRPGAGMGMREQLRSDGS